MAEELLAVRRGKARIFSKVKELLGRRYVTTTQIYDKQRWSLKEGASHDVPI